MLRVVALFWVAALAQWGVQHHSLGLCFCERGQQSPGPCPGRLALPDSLVLLCTGVSAAKPDQGVLCMGQQALHAM